MRAVLGFVILSLAAAPAFAQVDAKTARAWKAKCASCHGEDGKGQTESGKKLGVADMTTAAWQKKVTDEQIKASMLKGVKAKHEGKDVEMPALPDLKPDQVEALTKLVRGLAK